jgi:hypothetical protein
MDSTAISVEGRPAAAHAGGVNAAHERRFFSAMTAAFALTVLAGFSRTYYFNDFASAPFELSPILHWHGAVYTAWMVLLVVQAQLIAGGRVSLHRRLGLGGAILAAAMVVLGIAVALSRTRSGAIADPGVPILVFLAVPLLGMVVFGGFVAAGFYFRRHAGAHKRLMLFATLELVTAAVARLPFVEDWGPIGFFAVTDVFIAAIVWYDVSTLKRVHPATLWGGLAFVASQPLRLAIGGTQPWLDLATWLTT